jgi:hypothetical protein
VGTASWSAHAVRMQPAQHMHPPRHFALIGGSLIFLELFMIFVVLVFLAGIASFTTVVHRLGGVSLGMHSRDN